MRMLAALAPRFTRSVSIIREVSGAAALLATGAPGAALLGSIRLAGPLMGLLFAFATSLTGSLRIIREVA
jgi:hypothetical protein